MSGGVDSSLSAALLVEAGYDVTGVFLKVWSEEDLGSSSLTPQGSLQHPRGVNGTCPWEGDLRDARAVAEQLGIDLIVKSVQRLYWDRVVADFLAGYQAGRTPNPDVLCNSQIKFGLLYEWAIAEGFDFVATGHYARIDKNPPRPSFTKGGSTGVPLFRKEGLGEISSVELYRGIDPKKDQTYFLWQLDQTRLEHILFPIGHLTKVRVRAEAERRGLATARKKDSQGICFLGPIKVRQWLAQELATKSGDVVDLAGTIIGTHRGAHLYTLGQRRGFEVNTKSELVGRSDVRPACRQAGISPPWRGGGERANVLSEIAKHELSTNRPAQYIVKRDVERNELVVAPEQPRQCELRATGLNWLTEPPRAGESVEARIRHGQLPQAAVIVDRSSSQLLLEFAQPQTAISPGQSVVLSRDTLILGGGVID